MPKVRVRERNNVETGEDRDGRDNTPKDMGMEIATVVTPISADAASMAILEPSKSKENENRWRRSKALARALGHEDRSHRVQRMSQQQARKLAQLHPTIAKMANMFEKHTAQLEVQWRAMKKWLGEKDEKLKVCYQDDLLRGKGITDMVTRMVAATQLWQRDESKVDTEGVGLNGVIHTELMYTGGPKSPEVCQQPQ